MIELRIEGQAVDVAPDTKITLNFNSNIFGDISKITPSNSLTISLPKTPKNAKVFGAPSVVGVSSIAPYRKWNAELYVNGVAMVDTAYAVLLSVGESYEIALYWGVVTALSTLKDNDNTLADLREVLKIQYGAADGADWWTGWSSKAGSTEDGAESSSIINASYNPGIADLQNNTTARKKVALLPSVQVFWLWNNIFVDNGLEVYAPSEFLAWLLRLAVPFTTHKTKGGESFSATYQKINRRYNKWWDAGGVTFHTFDKVPSSTYFKMVNAVVPLRISLREVEFDAGIFRSREEGKVRFECTVAGTTDGSSLANLYIELRNSKHLTKKRNVSARVLESKFNRTLSIDVDVEKDDYILPYIEWIEMGNANNPDGVRVSYAAIKVVAQYEAEDNQVMGGMINTRDNLPAIKQLDFVKALCAMYGLWATLVDGEVHLVRFADLYAQTALDWSHKLVGTGDGDAGKTTYTLADYAKRNILRYKEDDTVKVDASGALVVDNDNLDKEKEMFTLPFSASDGDVIPHLKWKDDVTNGEVEEQKVEPRIMLLNNIPSTPGFTLSFDGLNFSQLIPEYYAYWQKIMRNPIVIEEKVQLSEIDIKMLDFRKPIYLQKYGAQFAIDKVQWSEGEPSSVTLVMLPPAKDIGVALPYKVTTGVVSVESFGGGWDPIPDLAYLVSGAGDYFAESATLYFDEAKAKEENLVFVAWITETGAMLSTDNPFVYDGSNADMTIYAKVDTDWIEI